MQLKMPEKSQWLRVEARGAIGVDVENRIINGYVVAQLGAFMEVDPRGEFDKKALSSIIKLMKQNPIGTKSRFAHPSLSDDGIGKFLGRAKNPRLDKVAVMQDGQMIELDAVRADLHLDPTAFEGNPNGNLGQYVLDLAQSDPAAFASSIVLDYEEEVRLNKDGTRKKDDDGNDLPPLWRPLRIHASDVVDSGAAVTGFLSADILDGLPDAIVRKGCELLDAQFAGQSREVVESRLTAFMQRYLRVRFDNEGKLMPDDVTSSESAESPGSTTEPVGETTDSGADQDSAETAEEHSDEALALEAWVAGEEE